MLSVTFWLALAASAAPMIGPAPCVSRGGAGLSEPSSLDDLDSCQRRALDVAAAAYAQAHGGALPSEGLLASWSGVQEAEKRGYLKRHPATAAAAPREPREEPAEAPAPPASSGKSLTVYVAPWCPHCREATRRILAMRAYLVKRGVDVRIIVGRDSTENCQDYAQSFPGAEIDPEGLDAPGGGVPHFVVKNSQGDVVKDRAGAAPSGSGEALAAELGLP